MKSIEMRLIGKLENLAKALCPAAHLESLFRNRYILMPIISALRGARIEFAYTGGPQVEIRFHPEHKLLHSSDSLEEGVRQLINNYTRYVYSRLPEYSKIVIRTLSTGAVGMYFEFLDEQIQAGRIGRGKDKWMPAFGLMSANLRSGLSEMYYVPEGGMTDENEEWAMKQTDFLNEQLHKIDSKMNSLFISMGLY